MKFDYLILLSFLPLFLKGTTPTAKCCNSYFNADDMMRTAKKWPRPLVIIIHTICNGRYWPFIVLCAV